MTRDPLARFRAAQDEGGTYARALAELRAGRKRSHWMWFVFPQLAGLGHSTTAQFYAVADLTEAQAYLADPVLRARLLECCQALLALPTRDAVAVLGGIDAQKLRSSMTLFAQAAPRDSDDQTTFTRVLDDYFDGTADPATLSLLAAAPD